MSGEPPLPDPRHSQASASNSAPGGPDAPDGIGPPELSPEEQALLDPAQYVFPHPQWTVGVVLVLAVVMLVLGVLGHPVWLLIGAPFILTFAVWLFVRISERISTRRRPDGDPTAPNR